MNPIARVIHEASLPPLMTSAITGCVVVCVVVLAVVFGSETVSFIKDVVSHVRDARKRRR